MESNKHADPDLTDVEPSLWRRLGWFVLLYCGGVGAVGLVAFALRLWIKP